MTGDVVGIVSPIFADQESTIQRAPRLNAHAEFGGKRFSPRLRNLKDRKFHTFEKGDTYPALSIDDRLHNVYTVAERLAKGEGNPVAAAAENFAVTMKVRPDAELLALWLADTMIATRL